MNIENSQVAQRVKELREIVGVSVETMAKETGVGMETYEQYESGSLDIPISTLYKISTVLNTDLTVLMTGESPRMENVTVVRGGKGQEVERYAGYKFSDLAFNFVGRKIQPLMVTLEPSEHSAPLVMHSGQEFNYVVEGAIIVTIGSRSYKLAAGDSIYFNPSLPHGQAADGVISRFLTVIME